ncbi:hypothetical protein RhiirA5_425402 [Rhizophagus irregularis]|uniref:Uncharacterized protein n=1 Tax=Rhizophagus irregularis TaxID=588596 RepID=A0A2N0P659_9GLOM|nr:hypothetical protein RhiirA5_425402 [Rhizophagus irregularis]
MENIDTNIWNRRNAAVKEWERSLNINKQKKKYYRQHHNLHYNRPNLNKDDNRHRNIHRVYFNQNHSTLIAVAVGSLIMTHTLGGRRLIFYIQVLGNLIEIEFGSIK